MLVVPWLVLIGLIVAFSAGLLLGLARAYAVWRHAPPPFHLGLVSTLVVAVPILLVILAWGIALKSQ